MTTSFHCLIAAAALTLPAANALAQHAAPLRVCATTADLAALCRAVGGTDVDVTAFATGAQDPHFLEARPSFLRALNRADLLLDIGRELEIGWLPLLVTNARNAAVLPGGKGRLTAADHVRALGVPTGPVDRGAGDVHASGNPHFLVDPLCGLQVAAAIAARLAELRPDGAARFAAGLQQLRQAIATALVGAAVAAHYGDDAEKLLLLFGRNKLDDLLRAQGDLDAATGWAAAMRPYRDAAVVADHDLWPYFAERFGVRVVAFLEPKPGVAPTTAHLREVVTLMQQQHVAAILSVPYFAIEHARFVADATGARIAAMAHQPGSREGTDDYVAFVDWNVRALAAALRGGDK